MTHTRSRAVPFETPADCVESVESAVRHPAARDRGGDFDPFSTRDGRRGAAWRADRD